jgi:PAS domain S-box-containing protein
VKRTASASESVGKNGPAPDAASRLGERMLDGALSGSGDGAFVVGPDGRITHWNSSAQRILGYTAHEAIGRTCCEIFVGGDGDGPLCYQGCHEETLVQPGELLQAFDMRTRTKIGRAVWINISILVVPANGKSGQLGIHIFRDVTATKALLGLAKAQLASHDPEAGAPAPSVLTPRQLELLRLVAIGLNTAATAQRLGVSPATIRNHVQNIFGKLGVHSRLEAVAYARRHRLL